MRYLIILHLVFSNPMSDSVHQCLNAGDFSLLLILGSECLVALLVAAIRALVLIALDPHVHSCPWWIDVDGFVQIRDA